jgi:hypothetical protein
VDLRELEDKIKTGQIPEHPAWEDLIVLENLEDAIARLNKDMEAVHNKLLSIAIDEFSNIVESGEVFSSPYP